MVAVRSGSGRRRRLGGGYASIGEWTFQNWQSEFLEVFLLIVLTATLVHKGSHKSKDGDDEVKAALAHIEQRLESMGKDQ